VEKPFILLVDDNEATCTLITALLRKEFEVETASDGVEALEKLRTKTYATVILDLVMPQLDGYGVLDYLKEQHPDILRRVLIVSAAINSKELARLKPYEVCAVISKPFEVDTLLSAVKQCVGDVSGGGFLTSGVILLLADFLRQRLM